MHKPQSTKPTINVSVETGRNAAASNRGQDVSAPRLVYVLTIALGLVTTAAILGWMMMLARRGIDFSDEGYHLNFIANPGIYSASVTQFGFFYHPLFELVSENLERLRQCNACLTLLLVSTLAFLLVLPERDNQGKGRRFERVAISIIIGSTAVNFFSVSLTPNYNSMTLHAVLVASIGMMLVRNCDKQATLIYWYLGWCLIAFGGAIAFLSKPTSAVALAVLAGAFLLAIRKLDLQGLIIASAVTLLLIVGFAIGVDGSLKAFHQRLSDGLLIMQSLQSPYHERILRLDDFTLTVRDNRVFIALIVISALATAMAVTKRPAVLAIALALPIVIFLVDLGLALGVSSIPISQIAVDPKVMLAIPLGSLVAWIVVLGREMSWSGFCTAAASSVCLLLMPYVFAIGSGNNYWALGGMVAFFWALAALPWLKSIGARSGSMLHLLPVAALSQLIAFMSLYAASERPFRQPIPLRQNHEAVSVRGSTLLLGPNYAAYFQDLQQISNDAGFTAGTPIIDLTGTSAASLFAMRAKAIGQPWLIGGYPGSEALAVLSLRKVPCRDIKAAWLLAEPEGPRRLPDGVLKQLNLDIDRDYVAVGQTWTPAKSSGYDNPRLQVLMKPRGHAFPDAPLVCAAEPR
jgi:hypothetical protein